MPLPSTASYYSDSQARIARQFRTRYLILTVGFFLPLIWSFVTLRNIYPAASWNVMTRGGQLQQSYTYFILRGETTSGKVIDIPGVGLTDALRSRRWGLVAATANNDSFKLRSPHPKNAALLASAGGIEHLPEGLLMKELLRAWGETYNARHPSPSPYHLTAIRLDCYRWPGGEYSNFEQFIQSWREQL